MREIVWVGLMFWAGFAFAWFVSLILVLCVVAAGKDRDEFRWQEPRLVAPPVHVTLHKDDAA